MAEIPNTIATTFERVKDKEKGYLTLKLIKGGYYVYRQSGKWDSKKKKTKTIAEYLGKITKDGIFVRKTLSAKDDLENAKSLIAARGGEIIWHEVPEELRGIRETVVRELTTDEIDEKLLTALSMNARTDLAHWGKKIGLTTQQTYYRVKQLEERLGIKYTVEINLEKLGYLKFIGFVKFLGVVPTENEIRSTFEEEGRMQLVLLTSGKYDMIFFFYARTNTDITDFLYNTRRKKDSFLIKYKARWYVAPYYDDFGFLPVRSKFLEVIKKEVKEKKIERIALRDVVVLKELNDHSDKSFTKIDEDNKLSKGSADYSYYKLKRDNFIDRTTINATRLPVKFVGILILEILDGAKFSSTGRPSLLREIIKTGKIVSTYALVGDIEVPDGVILFLPVSDGRDLEVIKEHIASKIVGVNLKVLIVQNFVMGSLCYRRFDDAYAPQYELLVNQYKLLPPKEKIDYEETSRRKEIREKKLYSSSKSIHIKWDNSANSYS